MRKFTLRSFREQVLKKSQGEVAPLFNYNGKSAISNMEIAFEQGTLNAARLKTICKVYDIFIVHTEKGLWVVEKFDFVETDSEFKIVSQ